MLEIGAANRDEAVCLPVGGVCVCVCVQGARMSQDDA